MSQHNDFSAYLGQGDGAFGLSLTDWLRLVEGGAEFFNRLETQFLIELRCGYGSYAFHTRIEVRDDLFALSEALAELSERTSDVLNWGISSGLLQMTCTWNSSLDILCRVKVGQSISIADPDLFLRRDDSLEAYEAAFVVILPQIDDFLAGVRHLLSRYEPLIPF